MTLIYNLGTLIYGALVQLAALWNPKARKWVNGRKGLIEKVKSEMDLSRPVIWVHCASLGEFEQGRPIIDSIKETYPKYQIVLTFFSPSGYEVRKDYPLADHVYYLPLDTPRNAKRMVEAISPEKVFFIKYDYWYHLLRQLKKKNVSIYFVSAIFRPEQLFFKPWGRWYRGLLRLVDHFFVQNEQSKVLLSQIGIDRVTVSGDTRFDRVAQVVNQAAKLEIIERFLGGSKTFIGGSTWQPEEDFIESFLLAHPHQKWIVAPHEVTENSLIQLENILGDRMIKYSEATNGASVDNKQVLVIDCYGILTSIYQYGTLAFIGGGFGVGIHNTLEAATFGMPILFGPNYLRFKEAVDLVAIGAAFSVNSKEEFLMKIEDLQNNPIAIETCTNLARAYVLQNTGAKDRIFKEIF